MTRQLRRARLVLCRTFAKVLMRGQENLRLRTKLLLSFVLLTTSLTCATLLVVRHFAQEQAQREIARDAQSAISTLRVALRQKEMDLSHRADLLASVAFMRNGDATTINDAGNDPWHTDDGNLFLLADRKGKIVALRQTGPAFPLDEAQEMLARSVGRGEAAGWWFGGRKLYQVVLQPFYEDATRKKNLEGYIVVGHLIDDRAAGDLAKITSSDVVFRYGNEMAASTLPVFAGFELARSARPLQSATQLDLAGEPYFATYVELTPGAVPGASLIVLKSSTEVAAYLRKLNHLLLGLGLVAIVAGSGLIFLISATVTRPLASLVQGVQALEHGDFSYPLETTGHDELSKLTRAFDGMRATLQKNEEQREQLEGQLRQAQKMEALGRLAGGVAHDFNNLLTVIAGHSNLLIDRLKPGDALRHNGEQIRKTADRAATLTRQLLAFSRKQVLQPKILDVNALIADMSKLLRRLVREDIELNLQLGDSLGRIKADPGQIEQALLNLTVNAGDAMPTGGKLIIETQNATVDAKCPAHPPVPPGDYVLLCVSDTGHGMDEATKARIFEPFFTTKEFGKGTGLGLATVYGVVRQSGGFIRVESQLGKGARFELYLPRAEEHVANESREADAGRRALPGKEKTVLVVEDEKEVRELACEFLQSAGYRVLTAQDGQEALETAKRMGAAIHVVLTDVVMPRMRGPELGAQLQSLFPDLKIVYMTGYFEQADRPDFLQEAQFLQKPFSRESAVRQISRALNDPSAKSPRREEMVV